MKRRLADHLMKPKVLKPQKVLPFNLIDPVDIQVCFVVTDLLFSFCICDFFVQASIVFESLKFLFRSKSRSQSLGCEYTYIERVKLLRLEYFSVDLIAVI